jgi:hypothetical protein
MMLSTEEKADHQYFENRVAYLCTHRDKFHSCKSLRDIKTCLDNMDGTDHHVLVVLHAVYFPNTVNLELSFGQTKYNFYALAHLLGHFDSGSFDTYPSRVPLATVTVEFFLARPIPQWREYMAWHGVELYDLPFNMTVEQLSSFHALGLLVKPRLDYGVCVLCQIVNFFSAAHQDDDTCFQFLRNQLLHSPTFSIDHFRITAMDANLLIQHAFSREQYPIQHLTDNTGYMLLLRACQWVHRPHSLASLMQHASETWVRLFDLLLTRPTDDPADPVDISVAACASRVLALHPDNRSILDLYPATTTAPSRRAENGTKFLISYI